MFNPQSSGNRSGRQIALALGAGCGGGMGARIPSDASPHRPTHRPSNGRRRRGLAGAPRARIRGKRGRRAQGHWLETRNDGSRSGRRHRLCCPAHGAARRPDGQGLRQRPAAGDAATPARECFESRTYQCGDGARQRERSQTSAGPDRPHYLGGRLSRVLAAPENAGRESAPRSSPTAVWCSSNTAKKTPRCRFCRITR